MPGLYASSVLAALNESFIAEEPGNEQLWKRVIHFALQSTSSKLQIAGILYNEQMELTLLSFWAIWARLRI